MSSKHKSSGWAIVPKGKEDLSYTSAPEILGGGAVWEVYTNKKDAKVRCDEVKFWDAEYEMVKVKIVRE